MPTLAERLRASGYFTAAFCNNPLVGVVNNGFRRGFESFPNYSGKLSRPQICSASILRRFNLTIPDGLRGKALAL
nr:hypothetical protein [Chloroflexus sp.]